TLIYTSIPYTTLFRSDADLERIITMYPDDQQQLEGSNMSFADLEDIGQKNPINNWEDNWRNIDRDQLVTIIHTSGTTDLYLYYRSEEHTSELQSRFDI